MARSITRRCVAEFAGAWVCSGRSALAVANGRWTFSSPCSGHRASSCHPTQHVPADRAEESRNSLGQERLPASGPWHPLSDPSAPCCHWSRARAVKFAERGQWLRSARPQRCGLPNGRRAPIATRDLVAAAGTHHLVRDTRDLLALNSHAAHQALLPEDEHINIRTKIVGGHRLRRA